MPKDYLPPSSEAGSGRTRHAYLQPLQPIVPPAGIPLLPDESIWGKRKEYLEELEYKCTPSTVKIIDRTLRDFQIFLAREAPSPSNAVLYLRARLTQNKWAPVTANYARSRISGFFEWAVRRNYILRNPMEVVPTLATQAPNRPIFTEEMFRELQKVSQGTCMYYLATLAWFTGVRVSDACLMRWDNVDLVTKRLSFIPLKTRKRGVSVDLLLNEELFRLFSDLATVRDASSIYCHPEAAALYNKNDRDKGYVCYLLQKLLLKMKGPIPAGLTFHCLRHSRATRMLNGENKVSVMTAAKVLGLTNISTLSRYVHVDDAEKEKAMKA